jgi:hypothetical protein
MVAMLVVRISSSVCGAVTVQLCNSVLQQAHVSVAVYIDGLIVRGMMWIARGDGEKKRNTDACRVVYTTTTTAIGKAVKCQVKS